MRLRSISASAPAFGGRDGHEAIRGWTTRAPSAIVSATWERASKGKAEEATKARFPVRALRMFNERHVQDRLSGYIPHTVTRRSANDSSRRYTFSSQDLPGVWSNTTKWPASASHTSL